MAEFWEEAFKDKQEMWGNDPAKSALITASMFDEKGFKKILIPGIGYGRNAQAFLNKGMQVTGIEISDTAIALAEKHYGSVMDIYHGSVLDMPFNKELYDGIFCHALIHLLDEHERIRFIRNCYEQLRDGGYMVFTAISQSAHSYGQGISLGKDRYEQFGGVKLFFYNKAAVLEEFEDFGLVEVAELTENQPMYLIKCRKESPSE